MPLITFETNVMLYEVFIGLKKLSSDWLEKVGTYKISKSLTLDRSNRFLCSSLGTPCTPSCRFFSPTEQCKYSILEIRQYSLADHVHLLFALRKEDHEFWSDFYGCFHPKKKDEPKKRTTLIFPDDLPEIPSAVIKQTAESSLNLPPTDPGYWTPQRTSWALGSDIIKKRIAMSGWYWSWYVTNLQPNNIEPSLKILRAKHDLDEALSEKYGKKDLSDTELISICVSDPSYVMVKRSMDILGQNLIGLNLQITDTTTSVDSKNGIVSHNEQTMKVDQNHGIKPLPELLPHTLSSPSPTHISSVK